ncbi:MAG: hypothetical protein C0621_00800 [Desulfuromonas sp.]|nr:MAG: hypothetical protein C0621_00800 [Desulfuromonas sp.]
MLNAVLLLLVVLMIMREFVRRRNRSIMRCGLKQASPLERLGSFRETSPCVGNFDSSRRPHAVLLLHGYSASPQEFSPLCEVLKSEQIPFYAPRLTGFGLDDFALLEKVRAEDWLRECVESYDLLASLAERVSVVGISTGGLLAALLSERRSIHHLLLIAPNFYPAASDRRYKKLFMAPLLGKFLAFWLPVFRKPRSVGRVHPSDTVDPEAGSKLLSYHALPTRSLQEMWRLQRWSRIDQIRGESLTLLFGAQDLSVDNQASLYAFQSAKLDFTQHSFSRSGHNLLIDYDNPAVLSTIIKILQR